MPEEQLNKSIQEELRQLNQTMSAVLKKLDFIEAQNRRVFFSTSTYIGNGEAITWLTTGQRLFVSTRDIGIGQHLMFRGVWEKTTNDALLSLLEEDSVFVDVGAHLGFHTVTAGGKLKRGTVLAVEPNSLLQSLLRRSVKINHLGDGRPVQIVHSAVSDRSGTLRFAFSPDDPALGRLLGVSEQPPDGYEISTVSIRTIDDICSTLPKVDVIKLDVEGNEYKALSGARQTISANPNIALIIEFAPDHIRKQNTPTEFVALVASLGFFHFYEIGQPTGPKPVDLTEAFENRLLRNIVMSRRKLPKWHTSKGSRYFGMASN